MKEAGYICGVSQLIVEGILDLGKLENCAYDESVIEELDSVRRISVWTAELTMIRGMHRFGVMPADDLGVGRTIAIITVRTE
jgi:3-methyladenine DNA glycosylase/8-oxoguanine DNA glycosylase